MAVVFKEFLPNPIGADNKGEYFAVLNEDVTQSVNITGYLVKDASGKTFRFSGLLAPGEEKVIMSSISKIQLNNGGETLFLFDEKGELIDELSYSGSAAEGQVIKKEIVLTPELKEKYFDSFGAQMPTMANVGSFFPTMVLVAGILAFCSAFILNKLHGENQANNNSYDLE